MEKNYHKDIRFFTDEQGNIRLSFISYSQFDKQIKRFIDTNFAQITDEYIENLPIMSISVAACLADMHPQTIRQYEKLELVSPNRVKMKTRRYSLKDVERLLNIQRLSREGVNLEGIKRIIELEEKCELLANRVEYLQRQVANKNIVYTANSSGVIYSDQKMRTTNNATYSTIPMKNDSNALVIWQKDYLL